MVQLQVNFLDMYDEKVQSAACLEVCKKHNKPVIVMEPIKGGRLINSLPLEAQRKLAKLDRPLAEMAIRYVNSLDQVKIILSGMSDIKQLDENTDSIDNPSALSMEEKTIMDETAKLIRESNLIPCTACAYCLDGCPLSIPIPEIIDAINKEEVLEQDGKASYDKAVSGKGSAEDCIECGHCQKVCPQEIKIIDQLKKAVSLFS